MTLMCHCTERFGVSALVARGDRRIPPRTPAQPVASSEPKLRISHGNEVNRGSEEVRFANRLNTNKSLIAVERKFYTHTEFEMVVKTTPRNHCTSDILE